MTEQSRRFFILILIVSISGFSQGMLLPVVSVLFEQEGVSTSLNSLNATGLYIGTLVIAPFLERPLRRFGYKPVIILGGFFVFTSLFFFSVWESVWFWFVLRMVIGVGDHAIHYSTQTWITSTSDQRKLGRNIAFYGMSFGLGFAIGPLLVPLIKVSASLPFLLSSAFSMLAWSFVFLLPNDRPPSLPGVVNSSGWLRYQLAFRYGWVAFLLPFAYGFLEASLNSVFPIYALRQSFELRNISVALASFTAGGILLQLPLDMLGDRIGRKKVITIRLLFGAAFFLIVHFLESTTMLLFAGFFAAGIFAGALFSIGVSYMTDLTPRRLLATGNLLCGIFFSLGSLSGPVLSGAFLHLFPHSGFLVFIASVLILIWLLVALFGPRR